MAVYILISKAEWESSKLSGEYRARSLDDEGFTHCSQDEEQVLRVANRLFIGRRDMLVLEVDTDRLTSPVKRESSRSGEIYPHIYGPLNVDAVARVRSLLTDTGGKFYGAGDESS